ncbi:MAG: ImmA/IrrE family metallo-endopeptidase [bacterium]|nr:ImmA/IrrE family metallo-endopeptidase [bacterium]
MKLEAAFRRRCEAIAVEQRYELKKQPFDPLPAEELLIKMKGEARPPNQFATMPPEHVAHLLQANDWSAGIVWLQPLLIVYHPAHSSARHQSNLMHELAHVLLKHPMVGFDPKTGLPLRNPRCEAEAVYLGGCLQIPRLGLQWAAGRGYSATQVAAHFGASEAMVAFRSNMTGVKLC